MTGEVRKSALQWGDVSLPQHVACDAAVHFQGTDGRHDDSGVRPEPSLAAFYIEEFFGSEIGAEPGLGYDVIRQLERRRRRNHRIAAMRNIAERAAMDKGGVALERLDEVWRDCVLEQYRHRACRLEGGGAHRLAAAGLGRGDLAGAAPRIAQAG